MSETITRFEKAFEPLVARTAVRAISGIVFAY
jgi:hypothetical protein